MDVKKHLIIVALSLTFFLVQGNLQAEVDELYDQVKMMTFL